jgi:hypothetical protein
MPSAEAEFLLKASAGLRKPQPVQSLLFISS